MAFWNRKNKHRELPRKIWITPDGSVERLSLMVFESEHTLIAGATGCGKSTLLHGIMRDLLIHYAPSEAKLVLIDPKMNELSDYRELPHCEAYASTTEDSIEVLRAVTELMMRRYKVMGANKEKSYKGAKVFVVIDELMPLMISPRKKEVQILLTDLLTLGRASGICVIAATQVPSRKIIPAELVSNFTMRIGMSCLSPIESRQIIGFKGCEELPKHGKAFVVYGSELMTARIENTNLKEVANVVRYWQSDRCYKIA